jgi:hypothetical protein
MNTKDLGWIPSPRTQFVGIDASVPTGFCFYDKQKEENVPTPMDALGGEITAITRDEKTFKGQTHPKLKIQIQVGYQTFIVQTGRYTAFAKSTLSALDTLRGKLAANGRTLKGTPVGLMVKVLTGDDGDAVAVGEVFSLENGKTVWVGDNRARSNDEVEAAIDRLIDDVGTYEYKPKDRS